MTRALAGRTGSILVASDSVSDAALIKSMLEREFDTVETSTDPENAVADVEQYAPEVLILAFNRVENSERFCLGLFRHSVIIAATSLRTILLCSKEEVRRAYQLCQQRLFDDYVMFWPMTHDTQRLPMAVHLALRELRASSGAGASAAQFGVMTRRLAELETLLDEQFIQGGQQVDGVSGFVGQAERDLLAALDRFSVRLAEGAPAGSGAEMTREFDRLKAGPWREPLQRAEAAIAPMSEWVERFRQQLEPHLAALRAQGGRPVAPPLVLIVDDDALQRKLLGTILKDQGYRLEFAAGAPEAFNMLRSMQPDLILMDLMMPDIDGMAATRQIRTVPLLAVIPIIMITGNSGGNVVLDSLKSGATDFVVKPVEPEKLIAKIATALRAA
jgi:CheY-like chemotaxis protein